MHAYKHTYVYTFNEQTTFTDVNLKKWHNGQYILKGVNIFLINTHEKFLNNIMYD